MTQRISHVKGLFLSALILVGQAQEHSGLTAEIELIGLESGRVVTSELSPQDLMTESPIETHIRSALTQAVVKGVRETSVETASRDKVSVAEVIESLEARKDLGENAGSLADEVGKGLEEKGEEEQRQEEAPFVEAASRALSGLSTDLSRDAQDKLARDGEEQANLIVDHAEQAAKQDKEIATLRERLSDRYKDAPQAVQDTHMKKFNDAAEAVKAARDDRQATEMRELVEKQSRIQASPMHEDPTRQ
jgi:hypothetical protein